MTTNTGSGIIQAAYEDCGLIEFGQTLSSPQQTKGLNLLNDLAQLWQTQGLKLWLEEDLAVPLLAGTATYSLLSGGVKVLRVKQGYYQDSQNQRRPLIVMSRDEYTRLSNVVTLGAINSYFIAKQVSTTTATFWPTPDTTAAAGTAHLIVQHQVTSLATITDATGFPQEWAIALRWGLADELCTGQPQTIVDRCAQRAAAFRQALEDWDVEDAETFFQPDSRSYPTPKFR